MHIAAAEEQLNHPQREVRLQALQSLAAAEPWPRPGSMINNHIHTCYSFSPYSPTSAVYAARKAGLATAGIMDHDSVRGCTEFIEAGAIAGLPVTAGFELRVRMDATSLRGRRLNNPDQRSIAYVAMHGIPRGKYEACEAFLAPLREKRGQRNRQMVERLNGLLAEHGLALEYDREVLPLSRHNDGGSVTERHLLCGLARAIMVKFGQGAAAFLQEALALPLPEQVLARLRDHDNPHYLYDMIGALKSGLLPRFYVEAAEECPDVRAFIRLAEDIGGIAAYAYLGDVTASVTGDKAAQRFEDSYLEELFAELKHCGFHAVTYMPTRNTPEQLQRVMALCRQHALFQISGEDINHSRQSFLCPKLAQPEFRHLSAAAWALIGHEKAAPGTGMFAAETLAQYPSMAQRIAMFAAEGRKEK